MTRRRKQYSGAKRRKGDPYRGPFLGPFSAFRHYVKGTARAVRVTTSKLPGGRRQRNRPRY